MDSAICIWLLRGLRDYERKKEEEKDRKKTERKKKGKKMEEDRKQERVKERKRKTQIKYQTIELFKKRRKKKCRSRSGLRTWVRSAGYLIRKQWHNSSQSIAQLCPNYSTTPSTRAIALYQNYPKV